MPFILVCDKSADIAAQQQQRQQPTEVAAAGSTDPVLHHVGSRISTADAFHRCNSGLESFLVEWTRFFEYVRKRGKTKLDCAIGLEQAKGQRSQPSGCIFSVTLAAAIEIVIVIQTSQTP